MALFWVGFHYVWKDVLNSQITPDIETNLNCIFQYAMKDSTTYILSCFTVSVVGLLWQTEAEAIEAAEIAVVG